MADTTILIDAYSQIFRSFYAVRLLTDPQGLPVNALYIFTKLLLELEKDYPTNSGAMLFDCGKVDFRLKLNPDYKANRPPMPDDLQVQIPRLKEMASAFGWQLFAEPGFEADDLIGGIVCSNKERDIRIVSSDKDLSQLVTDKVKLLSPASGKGGFEERGIDFVVGKFGVGPELIADYLALVGDSSDNIPGVPGIGPKGAADFLKLTGGIERYLENPELISGSKYEAKVAGQEELLKRNLQLVRLRCELPESMRDVEKVLQKRAADWDKIRSLCEEAGFKSVVKYLPESKKIEEAPEDDLFSLPPQEKSVKKPEKTDSGAENFVQGELF